mgnify:CR=1 FL=1
MTTTSAQKLRGACEVVVATTLSYGFDWTFHNPLCGLLFQCGCTWNCGPWSGAACRGGWDDCNVHNARKPWCPWCRAPQDHPAWAWTVSDPFTVALMATAFDMFISATSTPMRDLAPTAMDAEKFSSAGIGINCLNGS